MIFCPHYYRLLKQFRNSNFIKKMFSVLVRNTGWLLNYFGVGRAQLVVFRTCSQLGVGICWWWWLGIEVGFYTWQSMQHSPLCYFQLQLLFFLFIFLPWTLLISIRQWDFSWIYLWLRTTHWFVRIQGARAGVQALFIEGLGFMLSTVRVDCQAPGVFPEHLCLWPKTCEFKEWILAWISYLGHLC